MLDGDLRVVRMPVVLNMEVQGTMVVAMGLEFTESQTVGMVEVADIVVRAVVTQVPFQVTVSFVEVFVLPLRRL